MISNKKRTNSNTYRSTDTIVIDNISIANIEAKYNQGYVFTRIKKGVMDQIRSLRINLKNFTFNTENRRINRKTEWFEMECQKLPLLDNNYNFNIHKLGKKFYQSKAGDQIFSASKIKELVTHDEKSSFNILLKFFDKNGQNIGYCICFMTDNIFHYAFPFYDLSIDQPNIGMGMILKAIQYSLDENLKYFYLGSIHEKKSLYKLQFENMEWWDKKNWSKDVDGLKKMFNDKKSL